MSSHSWLEKPPTPILSLSSNTMGKIDVWNPESLASLWTVFSKVAESLENGRRLENLSWRLWNRELLYCCDDSIFLVEDMTDNDNPSSTRNSHGVTPNNHILHPNNPPPDALLKSLSALSVNKEDVPQLSSSISSAALSDSDYEDVGPASVTNHKQKPSISSTTATTTHVDSNLPNNWSSTLRTNRSNLASSASTPTLSTQTTATPSASRISSPPTLRTLVNSNDTNSRPTIRRGHKSISDYRSLYHKRPSMKRKRLSPEKLHELMQLFRPVGQEVEYWQSLREERRRQKEEQGEHSEASTSAGSTEIMLPKEVVPLSSELSKNHTSINNNNNSSNVHSDTGPNVKGTTKNTKEKEKESISSDTAQIKATLAPTFLARTRRSSSRHRDSFNRERPIQPLQPLQPQPQPQRKVTSLFRRNNARPVAGVRNSAVSQQSAVADSDSYEDDESDFTDETDEDDDEEDQNIVENTELSPCENAGGNLRRSDTSTSIVRGFSPSKSSVSFLGRPVEVVENNDQANHMSTLQYQQVPRQKQKMFFIESSPSESDGFGESVSKSDYSLSPHSKFENGEKPNAVAFKSSLAGSSKSQQSASTKVKHVSVQSPPKLDSTKYDDYYNDDDDDSDWDSVESDTSSYNEEPSFSREDNLSSHNLVRPSLLSSMFLNNPLNQQQDQILQEKDKSRIFSKGKIPDESNSVSSKLGSMFSGQAKRVNTFSNLSEASYIVANGGLNSDGEDIARDNASVARSLGAKRSTKATTSKNNSVADFSKLTNAGPTAATVLSATPVAVTTHEPVYGSILPSDMVRHTMLATEMSQSLQKSLINQSEMERVNMEALKRRHTSLDLTRLGDMDWGKDVDEPANFDYHARGW